MLDFEEGGCVKVKNDWFVIFVCDCIVVQIEYVVYARNNTLRDLVTFSATVNDSYVDVIMNPAVTTPADQNLGVKVIHTVQYFHNQNPLTP